MPLDSCMPDRPSLETAKAFWSVYTGDENAPIRIALLYCIAWPAELQQQGRFSPYPPIEREGTLDQLWPLIVEKQELGYSAYYFANETPPGFLGNIRNRDVTAIRSLHIDCDNGLPDSWHVEPSVIVKTSQKLAEDGSRMIQKGAAYWLVEDMPVSEFSRAQAQLIAHYGSDKQVKDAKRVMRLPGSVHRKPAISGDEIRSRIIANPSKETIDSIPLTVQSLVTFTDPAEGVRLGPMSAQYVLAGLTGGAGSGTSSEFKYDGEGSLHGEPKTYDELFAVLRFNSPYADRDGWGKTVKALPQIPIHGRPADAMARKLDMANDFEAGRLFHRLPTPEERKHLNGAFRGPAEVEKLFNWALESGNSCGGFGALVNRAKEENAEWSRAPAQPVTMPGTPPLQGNHRVRLHDLTAIWDRPPLRDLVEGLITEREDVVFIAVPKVGKSFLALEIGLCIASGLPVLGRYQVNRQGAVIYLSGEGHGGMPGRIKAWCSAHSFPEQDFKALPFFYNEGAPLAAEGIPEALAFVSSIRERVGDAAVVLIIVDTMARSLGGLNENDSASANAYLELTRVFRNSLDCASLTIAHASHKTGDPRQPDLRGSTNFHAGFDSMWTLRKGSDNETVSLEGKWFKDQPDSRRLPAYFKLRETVHSAVLELAPAPESEGKSKRDTLDIKMRAFGMIGYANALTTAELANRLVGRNCPPKNDAEGVSKWTAEFNAIMSDLDKGQKSRGPDRPPTYAGLFHKDQVPPHLVGDAVEKAWSGRGQKGTVLWYIKG